MNKLLKQYVNEINQNNKNIILGDFLDSFYNAENDSIRQQMITDEPDYEIDDKVFICVLAGIVQKLSSDYNIQTPNWCMKKKYYLKKPWYPSGAKIKNKVYFYFNSPKEFKKRNIFVGKNTINRC